MLVNIDHLYIYIRPILESDIDQIMSIEEQSFGKHHWSKNAFINELNNQSAKYFLASLEINNESKVIGYIGYWLIGEEGHITTLAIDHNFRRRHIADILLYYLIKDACKSNVNWLTLEVRASNTSAIYLYNKFNFKQLGIRKNYYQDNNEDGIIYWTENINNESYQILIESIFSNILSNNTNVDKLQYINN